MADIQNYTVALGSPCSMAFTLLLVTFMTSSRMMKDVLIGKGEGGEGGEGGGGKRKGGSHFESSMVIVTSTHVAAHS